MAFFLFLYVALYVPILRVLLCASCYCRIVRTEEGCISAPLSTNGNNRHYVLQ